MPVRFQKGIALIFLVFSISLALLAYAFQVSNLNNLRVEQDVQTLKTLSEAKAALLAWAVNNVNQPGLMPYPDRNGDGNYDGKSDCYTGSLTGNYDKLLGQLPWLAADDANCSTLVSGIGREFKDSSGNHLWYAVSRNLVYDYSTSAYPVINPDKISNPTYAWLQVLDKQGVVISSRVAAVIIAPGPPLNDQDRSGGIADATNYLDTFNLQSGGGARSNRTYSMPDEDFYMGEDSQGVRSDNTVYQQPYYFNDKLVYITIDELMEELEKRAAGEARKALQNYYLKLKATTGTGYFPYASALGMTEYYQKPNQYYGFLPVETPTQPAQTCAVNYSSATSSTATCSFANITNVEFTRTTAFVSTTGGQCVLTNSNKTCRCAVTSGSSRCNANVSATRRFTCTATGCSTTGSVAGNYVFNGTFSFITSPTSIKPNSFTGICTGCSTNTATCSRPSPAVYPASGGFSYQYTSSPGAFNASVTNSVLPSWFTFNKWQDYLFYTVSSNCTYGLQCDTPDIKVGTKSSVKALIISTSKAITIPPYTIKNSAQVQPSCSINDYLDSTENTNNNAVFDATNTPRNSSYNDQMFIVAP
jgi:hypothetical protein